MKVEDAVAEAMATHVADVHAGPGLGRDVRRRHRARTLRFRTIGAALATAVVAVAVPVALNSPEPAKNPQAATGQDRAVVDLVVVPDVTGKSMSEAVEILNQAGLAVTGWAVDDSKTAVAEGAVTRQQPAAGQQVEQGTMIRLRFLPRAPMPQELGDLGDGRTFGGIHLGYLPDGLEWGKWSGKNGFGKTSYTTSFVEPGIAYGEYSIQVVVYADKASKRITEKLSQFAGRKGVDMVDIGGKRAYLANLTEGSDVAAEGETGTTPTIGWTLRDGLSVEVFLSPDYAKKIDGSTELKKIAEGIEPVR
jgi:hypothetical protein